MLTIALSHLQRRGVRLETHEAVALARELLAHPGGIPTLENIHLGSDGSASCATADGALTVASVAELLLTLLPPGTPDVPAPLRYAIARGLQTVVAPPFGSLEEFSTTLARFGKGASRDVLKGVLQRAARSSRPIPAPMDPVVERARPSSEPSPPIAPTVPILTAERATLSPAHASRWWAAAAVLALAASFAAGFVVVDRIAHRHAAAEAIPPAGASLGVPAAASAAPVPASNAEPRRESARVSGSSDVSRESVPPAAAARPDAVAHAPSESVKHGGEQVMPIEAVREASATAFSPAFASDGTAIFFHTGRERDADSAIEKASAGAGTSGDLGIMTIVDDGSHNYHAQPSPDGRFVAFDSDRDGERGVYVANRDGSQVRRVSSPGYAALPTWSPNNEWLAYIRAEPGKPSVWNLWVQPAAGGSARRLTNYRYGQTWAASWFPDDRRIAYSHEDTLTVMDLQTGQATRYPTPVKGQLVRTPAVSPDGRKIIFQVFHDGAWLLDLADGSMQRVLTDPTAEEFAWAPDGRRVAFHSRRDGQWGIYMLLGT
jgi:WD40-like Beta Propeller Repeat